jgi:hypothetical protein
MMPYFGDKSLRCLSTCHPLLQQVLREAINHYDFSIIYGHRGRVRQKAFDVVPYPDGFDCDDEEFFLMATYILAAAAKLGVDLRWGGHWQDLKDYAHFELGRG